MPGRSTYNTGRIIPGCNLPGGGPSPHTTVGAGSPGTSARGAAPLLAAHTPHEAEEIVVKPRVACHLRMERSPHQVPLTDRHNSRVARAVLLVQPRHHLDPRAR